MKAYNAVFLFLAIVATAGAADTVTEKLQRGLFEEEANHNLPAAIKEYQSIIAQSDEQRKVVATALFRLAECYRKLGQTNGATTQYQRLLRDYSEQEQLVQLAEKLTGSQAGKADYSEQARELERKLASLRMDLAAADDEWKRVNRMSANELARSDAAKKDPVLVTLEQQLLAAEQKRSALLGSGIDSKHPEVQAIDALRITILEQRSNRLSAIHSGAKARVTSIEAQIKALEGKSRTAAIRGPAPGTGAGEPAILTQAEGEELARVRNLAQNSPDLLNAPSRDGYTVLQLAARDGYTAVAEFVLSQNADPNIRVRNITPLEFAAQRGHLRVVQMLLDKGARPADGNALLHASANGFKSIVELLVARGADVNRATGENEAPLHAATWNGHAGVAEVLLKNGARPDLLLNSNPQPQNTQWGQLARAGATPLHLAVDRGNEKICELLLDAKGSASVTNYDGTTPLHLAAVGAKTNLMALLLERGANPNAMTIVNDWTTLMAAISAYSTNAVRLLLEKGADPNLSGLRSYGESPHSPLHIASSFSPAPGIVKLLLAAKANIEAPNGAGFTPLQVAVRSQKDDVAVVLLDAGANANKVFQDGTTLLHLAADGRVALVRSLLEHDANPNVVDRSGDTPLSRTYSYAAAVARKDAGRLPPGIAVPAPVYTAVYTDDSGGGASPVQYQWQRDGTTRPVRLEGAYQEIVQLLLKHGADPFMQRRGFIRAVRLDRAIPLFVRGTNILNQHTLMEALAGVYEMSQDDLPFPDWSKIEIHRLDAKNEKVIRVDAASMLVNSNCAADFPLEWGDQIEIPMADHRVTAKWELMDPPRSTLIGCNTRTVQLVAGGTNASITLGMAMAVPRGKRGDQFRLSVLLRRDDRFRRLLRTSSDLSQVVVKRKDPKTGELGEHVIDALRVSLPDSNDSNPNLVPWTQDFWLREGDVIEVPEKQ